MPNITGSVKDKATPAKVLEGAVVTVMLGTQQKAQDTIGKSGDFNFDGLEAGKDYTVTVEFNSNRIHEETVNIGSSGTSTRNLTLDPTAAAPATAPNGKFEDLAKLVRKNQDEFARNAGVNEREAKYFQQLYMVGNYVLARVVQSLEDLADAEERVSMDAANWETWWGDNSTEVLALQARAREEPLTLERLMTQVRAAFDLGSEPADRVNTEFKDAFRDLVGLCADDLLAVDIAKEQDKSGWDETKTQQVVGHYRKVKRALIRMTEMMSRVGRPDMRDHVDKWAGLIADALEKLNEAADNASGDIDDKHVWGFVSNLNGIDKSEIDPYIEHAPKGTKLMGDVLQTYVLVREKREDYTTKHLREMFHEKTIQTFDNEGEDATGVPGIVLHENASVLLEYWPQNWG